MANQEEHDLYKMEVIEGNRWKGECPQCGARLEASDDTLSDDEVIEAILEHIGIFHKE